MNNQQEPTVYVGITDHLDPELQAMLLAKYSRSYGTIINRLPTNAAEADKIKARLKETYQNYGHKSVGQLGTTTIFFEGVSILAAVAIEVSELFNGQESSTRYIPFDTQPAVGTDYPQVTHWQEVWRLFYRKALEETIAAVRLKYPYDESMDATKYANTTKARAFDICGGILPAGFTTSVGFTGTFDTLNDHISWMSCHPLQEVREIAHLAADALAEKYPNAGYSWDKCQQRSKHLLYNQEMLSDQHVESYYYREGSFEHDSIYGISNLTRLAQVMQYNNIDDANRLLQRRYPISDDIDHKGMLSRLTLTCNTWHRAPISPHGVSCHDFDLRNIGRRLQALNSANRKKYDRFPRSLSNALRFRAISAMDFRSYRDLHRHRNGNRPFPMLTMKNGPHAYYLDNLSFDLKSKFLSLWADQEQEFKKMVKDHDSVGRNSLQLAQQYAIPMAAIVPYYYECDLNQQLYLIELRTDKTVHQTLRIEQMAACEQLASILPKVKVHADMSENNFTLRRGAQTFIEK